MVKRVLSSLVCIWIIAALILCPVLALDTHVFDMAGLFGDSETASLEAETASVIESTGVDIVILTSNSTDGKSSIEYADDFYDNGGFGIGPDMDGILYFIDMDNRVPTISTCGSMIDYVDDSRLSDMLDDVYEYLVNGDFSGSAYAFLDDVQKYVKAGIPEGQYQYDSETGEVLHITRKITPGELAAAFILALIPSLILFSSVRKDYNMKQRTYAYDSRALGAVNLTNKLDQYLTTSVSRTPIIVASNNSGRGSGGGSIGHGSAVHTSSGGHMHGGGSGKHF